MIEPKDFSIGYEASLLKNIFHNASMGIVETDLAFRIRLANRAACELLNDAGEITGLSVRDLVREKAQLDEIAQKLRDEEYKRVEGKWTPENTRYHTEIKMAATLSRDDFYMVTGFLFMCMELPFYTVCCLCHKVRTPSGWIVLEELINRSAALSHTYCPSCMPTVLADLERTG
jgi:PAS domain S-box-containing protein